ncbi:MAG: sn-glycerol-3-phosphate ABC transporter ATP-binding protein UgpC [Pseudomonadota bacterium]
MSTLELKNLSKKYKDTTIISALDVSVKSGEFVVIVGPSGSGKSTLLRMVAGLEDISGGDIILNGQPISKLEPKDRDIAMIFQNYALYPHMTVFNNMAYGLRMRKLAKTEITKRINHIANILGLEKLLQRLPRDLSGGQRQRVAMGRALVRKAQLFLFDEPLSNLDAKLRVKTRLEIKKLQDDLKITSLYVTHDQVEAMTLADRIILLNSGKIEQIGSPLELYLNPASQFVAGFIGSPSMNFVDVNLEKQHLLLSNGSKIQLDYLPDTNNTQVVMGIRPEMLKVVDQQEEKNFPHICFTIEWVEALGTDSYAYGKLSDSNTLFTVRLSGKYRIHRGDVLDLFIDPKFIYLFDKQSGLRISPELPTTLGVDVQIA